MDNATEHNTVQPPSGRVRAGQLPPLGVADQVHRGQEHRPRGRQDAPRLRRHRLQARHGARALPARRQGRLGDGPDQRGPAPVRRQGRAARVREPRLLEPALQPPRGRERDQEARRRRQAQARRAAAGGGREGLGARRRRRTPSRGGPGRRAAAARPGARDLPGGPGGATEVALEGDDRVRVIDRHGGQTAELTARTVAQGLAALGLERRRRSNGADGCSGRDSKPGSEIELVAAGRHHADRRGPGRADRRRRAAGLRAADRGAPRHRRDPRADRAAAAAGRAPARLPRRQGHAPSATR